MFSENSPMLPTEESDRDELDRDPADEVLPLVRGLRVRRGRARVEPDGLAVPGTTARRTRSSRSSIPPAPRSALNSGLERARHGLVVCVHQDVSLPRAGTGSIARQYRRAERRFGPIGVAGVYGVGDVICLHRPEARPPWSGSAASSIGSACSATDPSFRRGSPPSTSCS